MPVTPTFRVLATYMPSAVILARAVLVEDTKTWLEWETSEHEYFWSCKVLRIMGTLGCDYKEFLGEGLSSDEKANMIVGLDIPFGTDAAGQVCTIGRGSWDLDVSRLATGT